MAFHSARTISRHHGVLPFPSRRRTYLYLVQVALAGLGDAISEARRLRRDQERLSELSDHQLRDIGLRRNGPGGTVSFILDDDARPRSW